MTIGFGEPTSVRPDCRMSGALQERQLITMAYDFSLCRVVTIAKQDFAPSELIQHNCLPPSVFRVVFLRKDELTDLDLIPKRGLLIDATMAAGIRRWTGLLSRVFDLSRPFDFREEGASND